MLFNSIEFLVFFAVVYGLYLILSHRWQNRLLILASCIFYSFWNWKFLIVMFASISTDYFCSRAIYNSTDRATRKKFLIISVLVNLSILGFFKYCNFFLQNLIDLLNVVYPVSAGTVHLLNIILPIGISFYTFEAISYVVDVYRGVTQPAKSYWDYLLFVIYFPHLVAGPIMRGKTFLPQVSNPRRVTWEKFYEGSYLFFWGLFEKMFVADNLAKIVDPIFAKTTYTGAEVWIALYAFSFQIFCDFDGYSNMARGLGKMMGFEIMINFNLPYFAANAREFWQRWHISLSTWLRDYLYIPLGGSHVGELVTYRNLMITLLLGGLWHGASWTFVLWGLYHGFLLVIQHFKEFKKGEASKSSPFHFLKIILFFHVVAFGWLMFRSKSFEQLWAMSSSLFNLKFDSHIGSLFLNFVAIVSPLLIIQLFQYKKNDLLYLYKQHWFVKTAVYAFLTYLVLGWGVLAPEQFIYFQF